MDGDNNELGLTDERMRNIIQVRSHKGALI